jgi:hypothetical protein
MFTGNKDVDKKILLLLDDDSLKNIIFVNKYFKSLINSNFWKQKLYDKYNISFELTNKLRQDINLDETTLYFKLKKIELTEHVEIFFHNFYNFIQLENMIKNKSDMQEMELHIKQMDDFKDVKFNKYFLEIWKYILAGNVFANNLPDKMPASESFDLLVTFMKINIKMKSANLIYKYLKDLDFTEELNSIQNSIKITEMFNDIYKNK